VKIRNSSLSVLTTLALAGGMISWGTALNAQTTPSTPSQTQQPETQPAPDTPPAQQTPQRENSPATQTPDQTRTPDSRTPESKTATPSAATPSADDSQSFLGTVVKSGDKYMLKDDAGKTYDIDHQDEVKKFEGKRVKVQGTLDATGTKITVK
jgi:hypothetical protein